MLLPTCEEDESALPGPCGPYGGKRAWLVGVNCYCAKAKALKKSEKETEKKIGQDKNSPRTNFEATEIAESIWLIQIKALMAVSIVRLTSSFRSASGAVLRGETRMSCRGHDTGPIIQIV